MKKLITIILVLVMLVSILALPAAAANVQPRYPIGYCRACGNLADYRGVNTALNMYQYYCASCNVWTYVAK